MVEVKYEVEQPQFTGRNVPFSEIARPTRKEAHYIRLGFNHSILQSGQSTQTQHSHEYLYVFANTNSLT